MPHAGLADAMRDAVDRLAVPDASLPPDARLAAVLEEALTPWPESRVACWGTGEMGQAVARALGDRLAFFIDRDPRRLGAECCGRPVLPPAAAATGAVGAMLVASVFDADITRGLEEEGLVGTVPVISARRAYALSRTSVRRSDVAIGPRPEPGVRLDLSGARHLRDDEIAGLLHRLPIAGGESVIVTIVAMAGRDRLWWEDRLFDAGFRKHPAAAVRTPEEDLGPAAGEAQLPMQKLTDAAARTYPMSALRAERDLHMDMLRESGVRSWAHLARYDLARASVDAGAVVLDAACGLGYGVAMLAAGPAPRRIIGVDASACAAEYARATAGPCCPTAEFHAGDATRLSFVPDRSVDVAVSFETIEHVVNPEAFLRELHRVLKPGGRLVLSVPNLWLDEEGRNPVPWHLHVYDWALASGQVSRLFRIERLWRQNAGGGWKRPQHWEIREIPDAAPGADDQRDAEWWVMSAVARVTTDG